MPMPKKSNIKLPQGSDYHGNGKYYSKRDIYRLKFPKGPDWKESDGNNHGVKIISTDIKKYNQAVSKIQQLEREGYLPKEISASPQPICASCQIGKAHKRDKLQGQSGSLGPLSLNAPGDLVHMDQA